MTVPPTGRRRLQIARLSVEFGLIMLVVGAALFAGVLGSLPTVPPGLLLSAVVLIAVMVRLERCLPRLRMVPRPRNMADGAAAVAAVSHLLGYARVSTGIQDEALQLDALRAAGCVQVYTDRVSGTKTTRPKLDELFGRLNAGDTVVVWRLDRLGRSLPHLIEVVRELGERDVQFRSLTEQLDTSTPAGRLLFHCGRGVR